MRARAIVRSIALLLALGLPLVVPGAGPAQQRIVKIGMSLPLTGAERRVEVGGRPAKLITHHPQRQLVFVQIKVLLPLWPRSLAW